MELSTEITEKVICFVQERPFLFDVSSAELARKFDARNLVQVSWLCVTTVAILNRCTATEDPTAAATAGWCSRALASSSVTCAFTRALSRTHADTVRTASAGLTNSRHIYSSHMAKGRGSRVTSVRRSSLRAAVLTNICVDTKPSSPGTEHQLYSSWTTLGDFTFWLDLSLADLT